MRNDKNTEIKNQQEEKLCSKCGRELVTDWEKEHELCVQCNEKINYCPTSIQWLNNVSGLYEIIGRLMIVASVILIIAYLGLTGFDFSPNNLVMCVLIVVACLLINLAYSAVGAILKGMADIIEGIERLNRK